MKLKDFYKEVLDGNLLNNKGWSQYYYGVFSNIINENNYKIIAEVGIGYGTHAIQILSNTNIEKFYLIDPMKFYPNDVFASDVMSKEPEIPNNNFNELYDLINNELSPWKDKVNFIRTESLNVTNEQIENDSLDCIFVDGDHSYLAVKNDLNFWWKKVKNGGQMLGDDYWMPEVSRAVQEFSSENNLTCDFLYKDGTDYKIFRFKKD